MPISESETVPQALEEGHSLSDLLLVFVEIFELLLVQPPQDSPIICVQGVVKVGFHDSLKLSVNS
jgi:hypothetical protein